MTRPASAALVLLALAGPPAAGWDLKPDPPAAVPAWTPAVGLSVVSPSPFDVKLADLGGPFVVVDARSNQKPVRRVHDLRTGKAVGEVPRPEFQTLSALDPTGTLLAAVEIKQRKVVIVFDVAAGKEIARVELEREPSSLRFLGPDRLLAHSQTPQPQRFMVLDARKGAVLNSWEFKGFTGDGPAVSPGGRYLAGGTANITVFDLREGKPAATLPVGIPALCRGTAFSADGRHLAAVIDKFKSQSLVVWSLEDGKSQTYPMTLNKALPAAAVPAVRAVRSGGWLLQQEQILDVAGKVVRTLPKETVQPIVREALSPDLVIGLRSVEGWTDRVLSRVDDQPPPTPDRPEQPGGLKAPVPFPRATDPDLRTVKDLPPAANAAWAGPLDAAPRRLPRFAFRVPASGRTAQSLHISHDGGRACVEFGQGRVLFAAVETGAVTEAEIPVAFKVAGESRDGTAWPMTDGTSRVDVYEATGKHIAGWKPDPDARVVYAAALGADRAVTVAGNGKVVLWELPACRAVWRADVRAAETARLSPGGGRLVVAGAGSLAVLDLATGESRGFATVPPTAGVGTRLLALRPDGKELALIVPDPGGFRQVALWNLETGKPAGTFPAAAIPKSATYAGPNHLVLDRAVFDLRRRAEVWHLMAPSVAPYAQHAPADGRVWYSVRAEKAGDLAIVPGELPTADLEALAAAVADAPAPLIKPGERVRVEVQFDRPPAGQAGEAQAAVEKAVRVRGFVPDPDGPVTLRVTGTRKPTGRTIRITDSGFAPPGVRRPPIETLTEYDVTQRTEMARGGTVFWSGREDTHSMGLNRFALTITIPDDKLTATEYFGRKVWGAAAQSAGSPFNYPISYAATVNGEVWTLPGQSQLTPDGVSNRWPAGYSPQAKDQVERAPAEKEAARQAAEEAAAGGANRVPVWVWVGGGGCLGMSGLALLVTILALKRGRPGVSDRRPTPPPLPRRGPSRRRHDD